MTIYQAALKTYESAEKAGLPGIPDKETGTILAPICHNTTKATIHITLTEAGVFRSVERLEKENQRVVIPVTEDSAKRTIGIVAHPLCDGLDYLLRYDEAKHKAYMQGLRAWAESEYSHPSVEAVLKYMEKGSLESDLRKAEVYAEEWIPATKQNERKYSSVADVDIPALFRRETDDKGRVRLMKREWKDFICWSVGSYGSTSEDQSLIRCWQDYVINVLKADTPVMLDMLTGKEMPVAEDHLKGIVPMKDAANAKLISFDDSANGMMRYLGRFKEGKDILTIGFESSQKLHNALKWIMSRFCIRVGLEVCVAACWSPEALDPPAKVEKGLRPFTDDRILGPEGYKAELEKMVAGYKASIPSGENVCLTIMSAPTPGRISVPLFVQFTGSEFLENLKEWDEWCCWPSNRGPIWSPSLARIADFALGVPREDSKTHVFGPVADKKLRAKAFIGLVQARISGGRIPETIHRSLIRRCEKMQTYITRNDNYTLRELLWVTCAVMRKYRKDRFGEEMKMALEKEKMDRSYQFGRLLAVMEKIEKDACPQDRQPKLTNAMKMQTVFANRPAYAEKAVMEKLKRGDWKKLTDGMQTFYSKLIAEIHDKISEIEGEDYGAPLTEMYLPGYYLQQKELYTKKEDEKSEGEEI